MMANGWDSMRPAPKGRKAEGGHGARGARSAHGASAMPAVLSAGRRTMRGGIRIAALLLAAFAVLLLLELRLGVASFGSVNALQETANERRLALNSIQNRVRAHDCEGSFSVADGVEGKALVFTETLDSGTFETRIYLYDGYIVEESTFSDAALSPEHAKKIVPSTVFEFTYEDGLLSLTTSQGTIAVALRSGQNSAAYTGQGDERGRDA